MSASSEFETAPAEREPPSSKGSAPLGSQLVPGSGGCVSSILSGGCGCVAFLAGAGIAVALFGAHLLSGWGERAVEGWLAGFVEGEVAVSGVDLSWREPQVVESITIKSPEGNIVVQAELVLPSLLELAGLDGGREERRERRFEVKVTKLDSRVDKDGTSDLGRTFGLVAEDGRSVVEALQQRVARYLGQVQPDDDEGDLVVELTVNDGVIDDTDSGRGLVDIDDLRLVATADREGASFVLPSFQLSGRPSRWAAEIDGELRFEFDAEGRPRLTRAVLDAPPLSGGVLRSLGIVPRSDAPPRLSGRRGPPDIYEVVATRGLAALTTTVDDGLEIHVRFGTETPGADPLLSITLVGPTLELSFESRWRQGVLVPAERSSDEAPLSGQFDLTDESMLALFRAFLPDEIQVLSRRGGVACHVDAWDFRFPLDESQLIAGRPPIETERTAGEAAASWLRRSEVDLSLHHAGGPRASVRFKPGEEGPAGANVLDWTHTLTHVDLNAELGGLVESIWEADGAPGSPVSTVSVALPGRALGPFDDPRAALSLELPGVTSGLLSAAVGLPPELSELLPSRLYKLEVDGIPVSRFLWPSRSTSYRAAVALTIDEGMRLRGQFSDGVFSVPSASLTVPITPGVCDMILERLMPWLAEVEPLDPEATLRLTLEDFAFDMTATEYRESAGVVLESAPLRVRLQDSLARHFVLADRSGWIEWSPAPIELRLEENRVRYESVELPFGDDVEPSAMQGRFDRMDPDLSLTGLVEGGRLRGLLEPGSGDAESADLLPVEVQIDGPPENLRVLTDLKVIQKRFESFMEAIRPGGG